MPRFSRNIFLFGLVCSTALACQGAAKTPDTEKVIHSTVTGKNSYYYYLLSQFKSFEQKESEADEFLTKALEDNPKSSFLWNQKAYIEAREGQVEEAYKSAKTSIEKNPQNADSLLLLGKLAAVKQHTHEAIDYYNKSLALDPKNEEAYNLLARDYLALGEKEKSEAALKACLRELPESVSCLYYRGTMQLESGQLNEALKTFLLLADLNPEQEKVLNTIGEIYIKKNQYDEALKVFHQLSLQNPDDLVSQLRVGLLYYQLKETDKAVHEFLKVSKRFPNSDKVNYFLGLMLMEKLNLEDSYQFFNRIPADSSFFKDAFNRQIVILKELNRLDDAGALIDRKFKDKTPDYYQLKVSLYLLQDRYDEALSTLNQALKKYSDDEHVRFQRAVVYDKLGQWEKSRADLEEIIQAHPEAADAYNYLGYSMAERGEDLPTALKYVQKASELTPEEGHVLDSLAWVYFKMNRLDKTLPLLLRAIKLEPDEPTILEHLGDAYLALKDKRRAREYYERSLKVLRAAETPRAEEAHQIQNIESKLAEF